ncbi:fatty acid hydroxylase domain-containing protein 2-like [Stegodyphus dumicola]|uniref:fatty acid hydroxylase domain-containing protein 2-like n=1 Tax=Stegodyphus dumicola TaxID=202533 RepID=UPI0015B02D9D|nr:fatty acid hydroxylase domain-containing protein 2-like [Stegodyphus dumicola]
MDKTFFKGSDRNHSLTEVNQFFLTIHHSLAVMLMNLFGTGMDQECCAKMEEKQKELNKELLYIYHHQLNGSSCFKCSELLDMVSLNQVLRVVHQVLINQILIGIPFGIFAYYLMVWRGYNSEKTLPTFQWVLFELIFCVLMEEAGFYYSHRLLHHPRIYKYIHKRHHEWTSPIAITAIYCHPVEHIFSNLVPPLLGPLVLGSHTATSWLWFAIAILSTLNAHSGFHFPFFPSPEAHDFHHLNLGKKGASSSSGERGA